jgi:hypothetical protein
VYPGADHRCSHPGLARILLRLAIDEFVRLSYRIQQTRRVRQERRRTGGRAIRAAIQLSRDGLDRHLTRHFSGRRAAHAVANHEEAVIDSRHVRVFVLRTNPSGIGAHADSQPHQCQ